MNEEQSKQRRSLVNYLIVFFVGCLAMYAVVYFFPTSITESVTKLEKDVTVTDTGIADAVEKVYNAVVIVSTYKDDTYIASGTGFVYKKENFNQLLSEKIEINHATLYDYERKALDEAIHISPDNYCKKEVILSCSESILPLIKHPLIMQLVDFIHHMRWYRFSFQRMDEQKRNSNFDHLIIQTDNLLSFQKFLEKNGVTYQLISKSIMGSPQIYVHYQKEDVPFLEVASSGTKSLYYYFYFSLLLKDTSFLFLDEFDALYHYETAETILNLLFQNKNMQIFVVSHNTYLMKNSIIRPDCCFILSSGKITSLAYLTDKEIQETHNLEKMYRNGAFNE